MRAKDKGLAYMKEHTYLENLYIWNSTEIYAHAVTHEGGDFVRMNPDGKVGNNLAESKGDIPMDIRPAW